MVKVDELKPGVHVELTKEVVGMKKNVCAVAHELLTIQSMNYYPVLIVTKYACQDRFSVHADNITTELQAKYVKHIKNDVKHKTVTKWQ